MATKIKDTQEKPNPPKRPLTAYFLFLSDNREKMKLKHPEKPAPIVVKLCAEAYRKLSDREKFQYKDKAKKLKADYDKDVAAYIAKYGSLPKKNKTTSNSGEKKKVKKNPKQEMESESDSEATLESNDEKELSNPKLSKGKPEIKKGPTKVLLNNKK